MKTISTKFELFLNKKPINPCRKKQTGFSLIEVIVAALILATGILGVAGLQIVSMKGTQQSAMKNQAKGIVQNLTERMRTNYQGVIDGDYKLANSNTFNCAVTAPSCSAADCSTTNIAKLDLHNLVCGYGLKPRTGGLRMVSAGDIGILINGKLTVACLAGDCSAGDVVISVDWTETAFGEEKIVAGNTDSLKLTTRISAP